MNDDERRALTPAVLMFRVQIGSALQKQRLHCALTQAELAEQVGLSLKYVGEIERGDANTSIDVLARMAETLGLSSDELMRPAQEPLSEGVRQMLIEEMRNMRERLASLLKWLEALNPAILPKPKRPERRASEAADLRAANRRARPSRRADSN